jgi:hypothetical protein
MKSAIKTACLVIFVFSFCFPTSLYAYIDAGTGSFMLQMFIAGLVGLLFTLKLYFKRIIGAIRKLLGKSEPPVNE